MLVCAMLNRGDCVDYEVNVRESKKQWQICLLCDQTCRSKKFTCIPNEARQPHYAPRLPSASDMDVSDLGMRPHLSQENEGKTLVGMILVAYFEDMSLIRNENWACGVSGVDNPNPLKEQSHSVIELQAWYGRVHRPSAVICALLRSFCSNSDTSTPPVIDLDHLPTSTKSLTRHDNADSGP